MSCGLRDGSDFSCYVPSSEMYVDLGISGRGGGQT